MTSLVSHKNQTQKTAYKNPTQKTAPLHFLIVGYSNGLKGDDTAGLQIAETVSRWHMPSTKSISTQRLTPALVNDIVMANHVIFIDACDRSGRASSLQLTPIVASSQLPESLDRNSHYCNPLTLLRLTQQLYSKSPLAWLIQIPTENTESERTFSSTTQRGCDQALRTIERFFMTYQQPMRSRTVS